MGIILIVLGYFVVWGVIIPFLYKSTPDIIAFSPKRNLTKLHKKQIKDMKNINESALAKMLHDPNVTLEQIETFKLKAKSVIEIVEMAQQAEIRNLYDNVNMATNIAGGIMSGRKL